jgi:hypothetical protein
MAAAAIVQLVASGVLANRPWVVDQAAKALSVPMPVVASAAQHHRSRGYQRPLSEHLVASRQDPLPVPTVESQRPCNRKKWLEKNPAPGMRLCTRCGPTEGPKPIGKFGLKNRKTGNRMPWCIDCGKLLAAERYIAAEELGLVNFARAHLQLGSPFIGEECPACGLRLEAGEEVEGVDIVARHVRCPRSGDIEDTDLAAVDDIGGARHDHAGATGGAAAPTRGPAGESVTPVLGWDRTTREVVRWPTTGREALENSHIEVVGASGKGKTQFLLALLSQLAESGGTRVGILDFKGDYRLFGRDAELVDLWDAGLAYNPLALADDSPRVIEGAIICIRDAVASAARSCSVRMGHRQLARLREALSTIYRDGRAEGRWPTLLDLNDQLSEDLAAAIGDLTSSEMFRDGPPLDQAFDRNMIYGLAGIPGDGMTQTLAAGFILNSLMLHCRTNVAPHAAPPTVRYALVVDEAHRVAAFRSVETMIREGRSQGLSVILATQQPGDMPAVVGANAATRICFGQPDASAASAAARRLDPGDVSLVERIQRLGAGAAVVRLGRGRPQVFDMVQLHRDAGRLQCSVGGRQQMEAR